MSDAISYDVSFKPSPATIGISVTVVEDALTATVTNVPDIGLSLTPSGNFVQKIISAVLIPIAELIVAAVNPKPRDMLQGKTMNLGKIPPIPVDNVTITASGLALGGATLGGTDYLKVTATLSVAVNPTSGSNG
ncbi:MAG: hypothetical protein ACK4K7_10785 [Allosphingosinicella sp.]|uniref:hypothetical protein n=1 Tax=Allosphingosinicella sp. TaxID=2823234 RepID=UPI00395F5F56